MNKYKKYMKNRIPGYTVWYILITLFSSYKGYFSNSFALYTNITLAISNYPQTGSYFY